MLCLTRQQAGGFGPLQRELANWSASHLSEAISRTLAQASVERAARQDGLTELANRRAFDARAEEELEIARQRGTECSLLLLDLDRFKSINDTYGHLAGDEVLRQTANVLRRQVTQIRSGERALIARYGGEEIAVLLPGIGLAGAQRVAETIRSAIEATTIYHEQNQISVTTSIGIAGLTSDITTVQQLVAVADAGLYEAKQTGRNRVVTSRASKPHSDADLRLAAIELAEAR